MSKVKWSFCLGSGEDRIRESKMSKAKRIVDMFEMANMWPEDTGLPVVIWVEERSDVARDRHGPRIKVMTHSGKMNYGETVPVSLEAPPRVIGDLKSSIKKKVIEFINLNRDSLMAHWNHEISTIELGRRLKKVE